MTYEHILVDKEDGVGILTLNRPDKLNAMNRKLAGELHDAVKRMDADDAIGCIVITGAGTRAFSAGGDIHEQREELPQRSAQQGKYLLGLLHELRSHPTVGDVRGLGLMCAVELVKDKATKEPFGIGPAAAGHAYIRRLLQLMEERGLLTRVFMALQLCPPLVVSKEEIDEMVTVVDESLSLAEREFGFA